MILVLSESEVERLPPVELYREWAVLDSNQRPWD
jgi:hypothetical protein